ncbi:tobamovirus multiplication protein 2A [Phragmites australis]|uniref:tobamovirus multiplication protein 2A n=1 Tax=Phragmites australis TaxID=29695 RepID=UPI002D790BAE|nr:tobamovirus multiplication protein 2A [Phragmites australis]XP_062205827.1 tobamovirus multiplication protein 2A [Phragmites australis]XP_062205828.1 tobamovirus multiplication protein 2A [Phragmites australis]
MAACRGFFECLLKLLNFFLAVAGLAMVGYGIYLLVEWMKISGAGGESPAPTEVLIFARPLMGAVALGDGFLDNLPKAWFIYLFIGMGAIVFLVSLFGCIGAGARNTCCLCFYAFLVILLILAEAGAAAFIFFDHSWKDVIPVDKTHNFDVMYDFLKENWEIARWVALGVLIFEALLFLLALVVRAMNKPAEYDSDDEIIAIGRTPSIRQPLIHSQNVPATGVPVPTLDQRASRIDVWSQRMREKYGLDTSHYTYNPSDPSRYQQNGAPPAEERSRCTIM